MDTRDILKDLADMGCEDGMYLQSLYEEGDVVTLLTLLKRYRGTLMERLHDSRRNVDRMDYLINRIQREAGRK